VDRKLSRMLLGDGRNVSGSQRAAQCCIKVLIISL
jgi:hypothetical protein